MLSRLTSRSFSHGLSRLLSLPEGLSSLGLVRAASLANLRAGTGWLKGDGSACGFRDPIAYSPNRSPIRADKWTVDNTLIVAGETLETINFTIDLKGETGRFMPLTDSESNFAILYESGGTSSSINSGFGTVIYTVDGAAFSGTRGELYALLAVAGPHDIAITTSIAKDLYIGGYSLSSTWAMDGQEVTNLVVNGVSYRQPTATSFAQATLAKQPLAFPVTKGSEYASFPGIDGNYLSVAIPTTPTYPFTLEVDATETTAGANAAISLCDGNSGSRYFAIAIDEDSRIIVNRRNTTLYATTITTSVAPKQVKVVFKSSTEFDVYNNGSLESAITGADTVAITSDFDTLALGVLRVSSPTNFLNGTMRSASYLSGSTTVVDMDISRDAGHMATSFTAGTGGTVTVHQAGQDPAMIVRHDGIVSDDASHLISTLTEGQNGCWVIAVFTVLGDGGDTSARPVSLNKTGASDTDNTGWLVAYKPGSTDDLRSYYIDGSKTDHAGAFTGKLIYEAFAGSSYFTRLNGGTALTATVDISAMDWDVINVFAEGDSTHNATLFLQELLILPKTFPAATVASAMKLLAAELGYSYA